MSRSSRSLLSLTFLIIVLAWPTLLFTKPVVDAIAATTPPAVLFLSPNTEVGLSLDESLRRLQSQAHFNSRQLARTILGRLGVVEVSIQNGIGDWSDGVENTLLVQVSGTVDPLLLRCAAAAFGLAASQKAVLAFRHDVFGRDMLHTLDLPDRPEVIRDLLDLHGIRDRTMVILPGKCRVVVYDSNGKLSRTMQEVAKKTKGVLHQYHGHGELLAGATQAEAKRQYHAVLKVCNVGR